MSRFEDAPEQVSDFVESVMLEHFPHVQGALIKVMFDLKKRKSGGKYVLARIKKTNDELKAFAMTEEGVPYDYVMFLDKLTWENISVEDREKLTFHELCHCLIDLEGSDQFKIQDHEIQTFYAEIEFTKDDPRWGERVATVCASVYDPEAEVDTENMV